MDAGKWVVRITVGDTDRTKGIRVCNPMWFGSVSGVTVRIRTRG